MPLSPLASVQVWAPRFIHFVAPTCAMATMMSSTVQSLASSSVLTSCFGYSGWHRCRLVSPGTTQLQQQYPWNHHHRQRWPNMQTLCTWFNGIDQVAVNIVDLIGDLVMWSGRYSPSFNYAKPPTSLTKRRHSVNFLSTLWSVCTIDIGRRGGTDRTEAVYWNRLTE